MVGWLCCFFIFINCSVYCWFVHIGPCTLCTDCTVSLVLSKSRSLATIDATTHNWIWLIFSFICSMYRVCHAHKPTHARIVIGFYLLDLCAISRHLFWIVNFCIIYFHNYRIVYRVCFVRCFWHIVIDCAWIGIMLCLYCIMYVVFIHSFILYILCVCMLVSLYGCVCATFFLTFLFQLPITKIDLIVKFALFLFSSIDQFAHFVSHSYQI